MTLHDRRPRAPLFQPLPAALRRALSWRLGFVAAALACVLLLALLSGLAPRRAYRVDDGEIDPVGECNLDAWHQRERHHGNRYQSVLSPACTFSALPSVQLGAALVREGDAGDRHSRLSPELKTPLLTATTSAWRWPWRSRRISTWTAGTLSKAPASTCR